MSLEVRDLYVPRLEVGYMVTALPDSPLLRLVRSMERETFSPIGRVPASEAGPAFSEPGLVGETGGTVGAVNSSFSGGV